MDGRQTLSVLAEVRTERFRQDVKWGVQNHPNGTSLNNVHFRNRKYFVNEELIATGKLTWQDIAEEEFLEAVSETDPVKLREELIQLAAVCVAWIECLDRREQQ